MKQATKRKIFKSICLVFALLLVLNVFKCDIVGVKPKDPFKQCPQLRTETIISQAEKDDFLRVWKQYREQKIDEKTARQVSLLADEPSQILPWRVTFWLSKRCWNADRFYYVEQRLWQIIHSSYLKKHSQNVIAILQNMISEESDEAKIAAYEQMIEMQEQIAKIEQVSDEELNMLQGHEAELASILSDGNIDLTLSE